MRNPNDLSKQELLALVQSLQAILSRPKWDSDTIEDMAEVLEQADLLPDEEEVERRSGVLVERLVARSGELE